MSSKIAIYERIKTDGKWREVHVPTPRIIKRDGSIFAKDNHEGKFVISWYENRRKKRQAVEGTMLSDAVAMAQSKAWYPGQYPAEARRPGPHYGRAPPHDPRSNPALPGRKIRLPTDADRP